MQSNVKTKINKRKTILKIDVQQESNLEKFVHIDSFHCYVLIKSNRCTRTIYLWILCTVRRILEEEKEGEKI